MTQFLQPDPMSEEYYDLVRSFGDDNEGIVADIRSSLMDENTIEDLFLTRMMGEAATDVAAAKVAQPQTQVDMKALFSKNRPQMPKRKTSSFRGVSFNNKSKKWKSVITINKKQTFLGYFSSEVEAAKKYDEASLRLRGEHAKTNFGNNSCFPFHGGQYYTSLGPGPDLGGFSSPVSKSVRMRDRASSDETMDNIDSEVESKELDRSESPRKKLRVTTEHGEIEKQGHLWRPSIEFDGSQFELGVFDSEVVANYALAKGQEHIIRMRHTGIKVFEPELLSVGPQIPRLLKELDSRKRQIDFNSSTGKWRALKLEADERTVLGTFGSDAEALEYLWSYDV